MGGGGCARQSESTTQNRHCIWVGRQIEVGSGDFGDAMNFFRTRNRRSFQALEHDVGAQCLAKMLFLVWYIETKLPFYVATANQPLRNHSGWHALALVRAFVDAVQQKFLPATCPQILCLQLSSYLLHHNFITCGHHVKQALKQTRVLWHWGATLLRACARWATSSLDIDAWISSLVILMFFVHATFRLNAFPWRTCFSDVCLLNLFWGFHWWQAMTSNLFLGVDASFMCAQRLELFGTFGTTGWTGFTWLDPAREDWTCCRRAWLPCLAWILAGLLRSLALWHCLLFAKLMSTLLMLIELCICRSRWGANSCSSSSQAAWQNDTVYTWKNVSAVLTKLDCFWRPSKVFATKQNFATCPRRGLVVVSMTAWHGFCFFALVGMWCTSTTSRKFVLLGWRPFRPDVVWRFSVLEPYQPQHITMNLAAFAQARVRAVSISRSSVLFRTRSWSV